jgi:hypothetical protein
MDMKTKSIGLLSVIAFVCVVCNSPSATCLATEPTHPHDEFAVARRNARAPYNELKASHPYIAKFFEAVEQARTNDPGRGPLMPAFVKGTLSTTCSVSYCHGVSVQMGTDPYGGRPGLIPQITFPDGSLMVFIEIVRTSQSHPDLLRIPQTDRTRAYRRDDVCMRFMIHPCTDPQLVTTLFSIAEGQGWKQVSKLYDAKPETQDGEK